MELTSATIHCDPEIQFAGQTARYKQVPFHGKFMAAEIRITGTIPATLSDFKIDPPSLLAVPVKTTYRVRVDMTWRRSEWQASLPSAQPLRLDLLFRRGFLSQSYLRAVRRGVLAALKGKMMRPTGISDGVEAARTTSLAAMRSAFLSLHAEERSYGWRWTRLAAPSP